MAGSLETHHPAEWSCWHIQDPDDHAALAFGGCHTQRNVLCTMCGMRAKADMVGRLGLESFLVAQPSGWTLRNFAETCRAEDLLAEGTMYVVTYHILKQSCPNNGLDQGLLSQECF